jgi:2-desacetyl-2-hydroxyethyl bacteriochlorophyllide A dehydrogenase
MKAVVLRGVKDIRVEHVPNPTIRDSNDAIVQVQRAAICGADLLPFYGLTPGFEYGTILGHEFVGVVIEVGPAVQRVQPKERVVCTSTISDGTCAHCRAGRPSQCQHRALFGYSGVYPRLDGGQAELVRVPMADRCLWPVPEAVSEEAALFIADVLPTAYGAIRRGDVGIGDLVVVVGCGPVGLMAVLCAVGIARGVIAIDPVPTRRELAERLGARAVVPDEAEHWVYTASDGLGADLVVEAAGSPVALDLALRLTRGRGTISVIGAHFEPDYALNAALMFERELTLRFTIGDPVGDRELLLALIAAGKLDPTPIISHHLPLDQAVEAYHLFAQRQATKIVLQP